MRIGAAKESYAADAALFDSSNQHIALGLLALTLCVFPFVASEYWLYLACLVTINIASTTGLNILTGYTGLVSLGQAAFMGLGAYTVAILQIRFGSPFLLNLLAGGLVAMLAGVVVGLPSLRVKGLYLAIATIAAGVIAHFIFSHFTALTGGTSGLSVPPARFFGIDLDTSFKIYWLIVPVTLLMLLGAANLFRTRIGRAFIAIRDRDISAEVLGIPLLQYKLLSFAISSFYAGVAGGLFAYFFRAVSPETFPLLMSIFFLAAVIVGGMGSILGSILGAVFMTLVPEVLKLLVGWLPASIFGGNATLFLSPIRTIVFGLMIVLFLIFEPHGLAEVWRRIRRLFHLWPFRT
ncbi:MAG: branched-chain amino acid ABC transporter permease [Burkholderiales bacterium]